MKPKNDAAGVLVISFFSRMLYISVAYLSSKVFGSYDKSTFLVDDTFLSFLLRWDAINFHTIASRSYVTEHITAFFPLYPFVVSLLSKHAGLSVICSGVVVSNVCFCISALILYYISLRRYPRRISLLATIFFCFNPASIIYCTLYSESLFALLFLLAFFFLEAKSQKSVLFFSLCSLTRSNGLLFALFSICSRKLAYAPLVALVQILPFAAFQLYVCTILGRRGVGMPYSYVQKKYWGQGFLNFYKNSENIPNAAVALPFILFSFYLLLSYARSYRKGCSNTIVLMAILFIQTLMAVFFIHSQIFFRFVSFNPIIYWSLAHMVDKNGFSGMYLVTTFYFTFSIAYAVLFGAYYPPA